MAILVCRFDVARRKTRGCPTMGLAGGHVLVDHLSDLVVETDGRKVKAVANEILDRL